VCWLPKFLVRRGAPWRWDFGEKRPILCMTEKNTKIAIPILEQGLPELVWVGIYQHSKSGSPRSGMGFNPIRVSQICLSVSCLSVSLELLGDFCLCARRLADTIFCLFVSQTILATCRKQIYYSSITDTIHFSIKYWKLAWNNVCQEILICAYS
jgi:hypothetical protein